VLDHELGGIDEALEAGDAETGELHGEAHVRTWAASAANATVSTPNPSSGNLGPANR
jgi:hypothetical protein